MIRHRFLSSAIAFLAIVSIQSALQGNDIFLSLNLEFNTPGDFASGGTWTVVGKADERGIAGLVMELTDVNFNLNTGFLTPAIFYDLADQNPSPTFLEYDAAGFDVYLRLATSGIQASAFQLHPTLANRFFDVGVIGGATQPGENGTPTVTPGIASRQVPWGGYTDNPQLALFGGNPDLGSFTGGVEIATGTFDAGDIPDWGTAPTQGNVWSSTTTLPATGADIFLTVRYVVPEPATLGLAGLGLIGIAIAARRHKR